MINANTNPLRALSKIFFFLMLAVALSAGFTSCKSKKKLAQQEAAEAQARKLAKAKADLESILTDDSQTISEKEAILSAVKSLDISDPELDSLIARAERHISDLKAKAEEERLAREREERMKTDAVMGSKTLDEYFSSIANAPSIDQANKLIYEAMDQFSGPDTPVLIIISQYDGQKDYDRPTTISKYLNYLKDQKKSVNKVENVVLDSSGKIKELELIKK